jgi:mRNA interferase MazF
MDLRRGDLVVVTAQGDYGKPRPALIIQSDLFREIQSVVVLLLTSHAATDAPLFRIAIVPSVENGLRLPSSVMVDKMVTLPRERVGDRIGTVEAAVLSQINVALVLFLGLGESRATSAH